MTVYIGASTLRAAQRELDRHLDSDYAGRCKGCGEIAPCWGRHNAYVTFDLMGRLPQRTPRHGLSRPDAFNGFAA
jgi:hypothetical protein